MKSIALVIPYFGSFGNYFQLFLKSCEINPTIDFLFYTDCDLSPFVFPKNVYVKKISFENLRAKIQDTFDFPINLDSAYKLCDFKPFYGDIFKEDLKKYDFWGHCDVDLIFGKIRDFITDEILDRYDRILTRGHFTLYRNIESVASINKKKIDGVLYFKDVLSSPKSHAFDEWGGTSIIWKTLCKDKMYDEIVFQDVFSLRKHFESCQLVVNKVKGEPLSDVVFLFDKNKGLFRLSRNKREKTMYVHLQKRPMSISSGFDFQSDRFVIVPNKFINFTPAIEKSRILRFYYGHKRYFYLHAVIMRTKNLLKKIKCRFS